MPNVLEEAVITISHPAIDIGLYVNHKKIFKIMVQDEKVWWIIHGDKLNCNRRETPSGIK